LQQPNTWPYPEPGESSPHPLLKYALLSNILYGFLISYNHATCLTHLTVLDLTTALIVCEEDRIWSSVFSIFSQIPSICIVSLRWDIKFHTHIQNR
jgi:hypothetical protein